MKKQVLLVLALFAVAGCTVAQDGTVMINQSAIALEGGDGGVADAGEDAGSTDEVSTDPGEDAGVEDPYFYYFRCNATSWNLDDASQLVDTDDPTVKSLVFEVTQNWMVSGFDSCILFRTEVEGQWYPGMSFTSDTRPVVVDGGGTMVPTFNQQFGVTYPELGNYAFTLDLDDYTFTITAVGGDDDPTCEDGEQNGDETDIDCGGPECDACEDGKSCLAHSDCQSNRCEDGTCVADEPSECNADVAIDLGATGQHTSVPTDACVKVDSGYPFWWGTSRAMNFMNPAGAGYPVPFAWENTCGGGNGAGTITGNWQSQRLEPTSAECATVIDLQGNGADDITLVYYGF